MPNVYGYRPERRHINAQYSPKVRFTNTPVVNTHINFVFNDSCPHIISDPMADRRGLFNSIGNFLRTLISGIGGLFKKPQAEYIAQQPPLVTDTDNNDNSTPEVEDTTDNTTTDNTTTETDDTESNNSQEDVLTNHLFKVEDKSIQKVPGLYVWSYVMNNGNQNQSADIYCAHDDDGNEVELTNQEREELKRAVTTKADNACMAEDDNNPGNWIFKGSVQLSSGKTVYLRHDYTQRISNLDPKTPVECHIKPIVVNGGVTTYFKKEYKNGIAIGGYEKIDEATFNSLKNLKGTILE